MNKEDVNQISITRNSVINRFPMCDKSTTTKTNRQLEKAKNSVQKEFEGKICIVTGATQGVGAAVAKHFAEGSAEGVVVCGRNSQRGTAVANDLKSSGTDALFISSELGLESNCINIIQQTLKRFGRIDILINAGGITLFSRCCYCQGITIVT